MKKLIFIILCLVSGYVTAQDYPIYSPVRIYGTLVLDPYTNLPTGASMQLAVCRDTLWIYRSGWKALYPYSISSDTIAVIYLTDRVKFVDGGWVKTVGAGVQISPNGSSVNVLTVIANEEPYGLTVNGLKTMEFSSYSTYQDPLRGFTNDTNSTHYPDSTFTLSRKAIGQLIAANSSDITAGNGLMKDGNIIKLSTTSDNKVNEGLNFTSDNGSLFSFITQSGTIGQPTFNQVSNTYGSTGYQSYVIRDDSVSMGFEMRESPGGNYFMRWTYASTNNTDNNSTLVMDRQGLKLTTNKDSATWSDYQLVPKWWVLDKIGSGSGGGSGTVTTDLNQIGVGTGDDQIGGYADFLFTGSTRTAGAYYTGTTWPSSTNRMNFDGSWYTHSLYAGTASTDNISVSPTQFQILANNNARTLFQPSVSDGATAVPYIFDTRYTMSTTGALLASFRNAGTEKASINKDGVGYFGGLYIGPYQTLNPKIYVYDGTSVASNNTIASSGGWRAGTTSNTYEAGYFWQGNTLAANNNVPTFSIIRNTAVQSYDLTAPVLLLDDNATLTTGSISGGLISSSISGTEVMNFNPRVINGSSSVAYMFDTYNTLSGNAKVLEIRNDNTPLLTIKPDSIISEVYSVFKSDVFFKQFGTLPDTMTMVWLPDGRMDSSSMVDQANEGWQAKIEPYLFFYLKSKKKQALPLPYPPSAGGKDRRKVNAMHKDYQFEFELERLHRYFFRQWLENKFQWLIIFGLAYLLFKKQKQIIG